MDMMQTAGQCDNGFACVYQNNLSWSSPTTPLPSEAHPRVVFERLFGEGGGAEERRAALRKRASLLDWVGEDIARLRLELGAGDRARVDGYLETVREVERRIQRAEAEVGERPLPDLDRPPGVPASYAEHARLMFDLQVLAMQGDVTRVCTFQLARETSNRTYPEIGVPDPHHPLSHHGNDPAKHEKIRRINRFHVGQFAYLLDRLAQAKEGDHSLLDDSMIVYGGCIGDGNRHDHENLPVILAGGGGGSLRPGRHLLCAAKTPMNNLHLALLDRFGAPIDSLGDSTGRLEGI